MKTINILPFFLTSSGTCDRCRQISNDMLIWLFPSRRQKTTCDLLIRYFRQANLADAGTVWLSCARTSFIIIVIFAFGKETQRRRSLLPRFVFSLSVGQIDLLDGFSHFRCALFKTSFIKTFLFLSFLFSTPPDFPTCAQRTFAQLPYLISLKKQTCLSLSPSTDNKKLNLSTKIPILHADDARFNRALTISPRLSSETFTHLDQRVDGDDGSR